MVHTAAEDTGRLDGVSRMRIFSVLAIIVLFTEVAPLQYTMVAAALQKIAPTFPHEGANINWAIIIFGLIGAAASPLIGKMSDVWGKKRMFLACGLIFLAGCALDAMTSSWWVFLVGRGLQAVAIATAVIAYGLVRDLMPRKYVPLGLGITATGLGFSALAAPIIGGYLVDNFSWRAIFWFLFAYTVVMIPLMVAVVPESPLRVDERIDVVGAALLSAGAALTLIYLDKGQDWGWSKPTTLLWLVGGLALLLLFFVVETRVSTPIMDMKLLFHPRVAMVLLAALFASFVIGVENYAMGYMSETPGADVVKSGVLQGTLAKVGQLTGQQLPPSAVQVKLDPGYTYGNGFGLLSYATHIAILGAALAMVFGAVAGAMARRIGARIPLLIALVIFVGSAVSFAVTPHTWQMFLLLNAIFGIGFGFYYAATPILIVEGVPQEQQGISVGMLGVMQSMGVAIGLAIVTALLNNSPVKAHVSVAGGPPNVSVVPQIFADRGYELGFWMVATASLVALVVAVLMRHGRTPATGGAGDLAD